MTITITAEDIRRSLLGWAAEKSHQTGTLWHHVHIAKVSGVPEAVVLRMILGKATTEDEQHIPAIAEAFDITTSQLLGS
jgi:hypothetical protein